MELKNLVVKQELFEKIGVEVNQLYACINNNYDLLLNGSINCKMDGLGEKIFLKANLCNASNQILYIIQVHNSVDVSKLGYTAFSISFADVSRYVDIFELHHIEIYPGL